MTHTKIHTEHCKQVEAYVKLASWHVTSDHGFRVSETVVIRWMCRDTLFPNTQQPRTFNLIFQLFVCCCFILIFFFFLFVFDTLVFFIFVFFSIESAATEDSEKNKQVIWFACRRSIASVRIDSRRRNTK